MFTRKILFIFIAGCVLSHATPTNVSPYYWGEGKLLENYDPSKEVISKRNMNSKHFRNDDGSYTAVISAAPIHYLNDRNEWHEIDCRIRETKNSSTYTYCNETNIFKTYFPTELQNAGIKFGELDYWQDIHLSWTDTMGIEHPIFAISNTITSVNENKITYSDFSNGISLEYEITHTQLRAKIIFHRVPPVLQEHEDVSWLNIIYKIKLPDGATINGEKELQDFSTDGMLEIKDSQGNTYFLTTPEKPAHRNFLCERGKLRFITIDGEQYCYIQIPAEWITDKTRNEHNLLRTASSSDDIEGTLEIMAVGAFYPNNATGWTGSMNYSPTYGYGGRPFNGAGSCGILGLMPVVLTPSTFTYGETRSWVQFNISGLSGATAINSATVKFNIYYWEEDYVPLTVQYYKANTATCGACQNWGPITCANVFNTCMTTGSAYNATGHTWPYSGWTTEQSLGATACNDIYNAIASGYYAIGCKVNSSGNTLREAYAEDAGANAPTLTVDYTAGCSEPTTQASNVTFSNVQSCGVTVSWTNGNGTGRIVFMKETNTGTSAPVDGTTYTANPVFGMGSQIGSTGWYCVYNGTGTSVSVTGLNPSTTYRVHVCEYDCSPINYNVNSGTNNPNNQVTTAMSYGTVASGDEAICSGGDPSNITMSSPPVGSGSFNYQWYYQDGLVTCPTGTSTSGWTLISGATGSSYDPPSGLTNSRTYAVFVTPSGSPTCGTAQWASNCRKVTVNYPPSITAHPNSRNVPVGGNTTFSVSATGDGLSYQWQVNTGSGWNNITSPGSNPTYSNWNSATLGVNGVVLGNNGYQYRCIVSGTCPPSVTSNSATLYVTSGTTVPRIMNYQGKLTNSTGIALNGNYPITFRIYDEETGGNLLWWDARTVSVVNGLFDEQLNLGINGGDTLRFGRSYWMELVVNGELLSPRERLAPVSYAYRSIYADTAVNISGSGMSPQTYIATASDNVSTTSTSYTDIAGMSLSIETGANPVLILFDASFVHSSTAGQYFQVAIVIDGVVKCAHIFENDGNSREMPYSIHWLENLSAGPHTIKMQWKVSAGTLYHWGATNNRVRKLTVIELK